MKGFNMKSIGIDKEWQAKMDLQTLIEAAKIKKDPKRMEACKKCAKERKNELADEIGVMAKVQESDNDSDD